MVKTDSYVQFEAGKLTYRVVPVTEEIIRMIVSGKEIKEAQDSLIIEKKEYPEVDFSAEENAGSIIVKTVKVCAEINTASGDIIWKHADGSKWLSQKKPELTETDVIHYNTGDEEPIINRVKTVDGERNFIQNLKAEKVRTAYRGKLFFTWKEDEEIHGLGQAEEGIYNYRGHCQYLYQHNMRIPMPVLVSTEGYGILVDCCSLMTFNDDLKDSYLFLDTVDQIDYYFMGGHTMDEIIMITVILQARRRCCRNGLMAMYSPKSSITRQKSFLRLFATTVRSGFRLTVWYRTGIPGILETGARRSWIRSVTEI